MKIYQYLLFFIFISFSFAHTTNGVLDDTEKAYINKKKIINVCINPDWAPIEFRDKIPQGISIDILQHISHKIGLDLHFIDTKSWSESQKYLKLGKCDITPTAIKTYKREKYAIFTRPYLNYDLAIITTQEKPYVTNIEAIVNKIITRKKGSGVITKLKRKYPNIKIITPDEYKQMFELVANKKAYATIATLPVFAYYKKKYNLSNLKVAGFTGWKYPLRIMINKNETQLQEILDKELSLITPQTTQKIYEKWIVKTKSEINYKKLILITVIFLLILILILIWVYILHKKNQELHKLSEIKSQFLANMSHEIRTPLNAIMGFTQILNKNPKECKKYIPLIESSSKVLLSIIDNILNFSNFDKGDIEINKSQFYSSELKEMILFLQVKAEEKGISFDIKTKLPQKLEGDIYKIRDILIHLIDNAIKFTKNGKIEVYLKYKDEKLLVKVKDTGIGISKQNLEKIFKPFVQIDNRINKQFDGIGIGLGIAKKLVKVLGGELKVSSKIDKGSEFYFEIPIHKIEDININNKSKNEIEKILVVEDNKANQMFMKVLLKQLHIKFDIAENGLEAVEMYKKFHYPIILMDINMPIMDGITATKEIRNYENINNLSHTKIIAVTANAIEGDEEKFNQIMDGYISKPVDINKLQDIFK